MIAALMPQIPSFGRWHLLSYCCSTLTRSIGCWDKLLFHDHQPLELSHSLTSGLHCQGKLKSRSTLSIQHPDEEWRPKMAFTLGSSQQACRWGPLSVPGMEIEFFLPVLEKKLLTKMSLEEKTSWNRCIFPLNENSGSSAFTLTTPFTFSS